MKTTLTKDDPAGWYLCDFCGGIRFRWWTGKALKMRPDESYECLNQYTNFRRLLTEDEAVSKSDYDTLFAQNQQVIFEREQLAKEIAEIKANPYVMRKADKPDCVGLWHNNRGDICRVNSDIHKFGEAPPYHYLGPIPVIPAEQKPPQVVTVRHKKSGEVCRAIPSPCGSSLAVLNDDGSFGGNEMVVNWEVVQ